MSVDRDHPETCVNQWAFVHDRGWCYVVAWCTTGGGAPYFIVSGLEGIKTTVVYLWQIEKIQDTRP